MQAFKVKRRYETPGQFLSDIGQMTGQLTRVIGVSLGHGISPQFRERIMLVVTAANECRYCAHLHDGLAKASGVSQEEVAAMLDGIIDHCPEQEALALGYAQNWAENDGIYDPVLRQRVLDYYGPETSAYIETTMRMIRIGNLTGNTLDAMLDSARILRTHSKKTIVKLPMIPGSHRNDRLIQ